MLAYYCLHIRLHEQLWCRHLIECNLLIHNLVVGIVECLQHINTLLYLLHKLIDSRLVAIGGYGELMHTLNRRRRHRKRLYIQLPSSVDYRNLVQYSHTVLSENCYCI